MLPTVYQDDLTQDYTVRKQPTHTYRLHFGGKPSHGRLDGLEAMKQAIYLALHIQRFRHEMYSWNYGIELDHMIGEQNSPLLQSKLKSAITEALLADDRIVSVDGFQFARPSRGRLTVTFTVETTEGRLEEALSWRMGEGIA